MVSSRPSPRPLAVTPAVPIPLWPACPAETSTSPLVKRRAMPPPASSDDHGPPSVSTVGRLPNHFSRASTSESTSNFVSPPPTGPSSSAAQGHSPKESQGDSDHPSPSFNQALPTSPGSSSSKVAAASPATSPSAPSSPPAASVQFNREGTILIFDWDDTLLPSTWLTQNQLTLDDNSLVPESIQALLGRMAELSRQTLEIAESLGTVIIVTNAEQGWIELSCKKFMPSLYEYLSRFRQLSARTRYESETANCPFAWKQLAFRDEIYSHFSRCSSSTRKNVISLGDSTHERLAIISITRTLPAKDSLRTFGNINDLPPAPGLQRVLGECRTKSVKFIEQPNIEALIQEHELVSNVLADVVQHDDDLDLCIKSTSD